VAIYYIECGLPKDMAVEEILELSGKKFDPEAVRLFLKVTRSTPLPKKMKEILFADLRPGMVLAKGIYSPTGMLLIPSDEVLTEKTLQKLVTHNMVDPTTQRILVYI
jgi:hypothetical protein